MASVPNRVGYLANAGNTVGRCGKKMKNSPVVPQIVGRGLKLNVRNVGGEPVYSFGSLAQWFFAGINGGL